MTKKAKHHDPDLKAPAAGDDLVNPTPAESAPAAETNEVAPPQEPASVEEKKPEAYTAEELTNHLQRLAAEFENYKKRAAKEMRVMREMGMAQVLEVLLPVLDSFDQSLAASPENSDAKTWRDGVEQINRQLRNTLEKLGLTVVQPQKGDALDPHQHEVLMAMPTGEVEANHIVSVWMVGYKFKERLLRPAPQAIPEGEEGQA
jgi:molecular chaperone GrpE